jgi:hypothetical protein
MSYLIAITFRDNIVHKIDCGEDLVAAQKQLIHLGDKLADRQHPVYRFKNSAGELVFAANIDNILYAFIEETKE